MPSPTLDPKLLRGGDPSMIRRFKAVLSGFARRYFRTASAVESVVLAALTELLGKLERGSVPIDAKRWALTAASNAAHRRLTQQRRAPLLCEPDLVVDLRVTSPSEVYGLREQLDFIGGLLAAMPSPIRHALVATGVDGRTTDSVATELGVAPASLRKQLSRARQKLRDQLSAREKFDRLRGLGRHVRPGIGRDKQRWNKPGFARRLGAKQKE